MSNFLKKVFFISLTFLFLGCSTKQIIQESKSATIVFKTPKLKFYDSGFINIGKILNLQVFNFGNLILNVNFHKKSNCLNGNCFDKQTFNNNFLNKFYPNDLFENVVLGKPIFNKKNLIKNRNEFEQNIKNDKFEIIYKVSKESIYFKDKKNKILIKIKYLKR